MRIALFTGNYNYVREGANQALNRLVAWLEEHGHQVRVYSPVTDRPAFAPAGTLVPVPSIPLPVRSEFRFALGLPRRIRQDVEAFAPDLVHVATPDLLGLRAQSLARRLGVPVLASYHTRFESYLGHYGLGWARFALMAHLRRFYRRSDLVLAPNRASAGEIRALRGDDRVKIWGRGVDRALFSPERRDLAWRRSQGWADKDIVILFFGRLVLEKGVDVFVETLRRLSSSGIHVRALVVGAGPAVERFAPLPGATLAGHLDGPELARAVASADILLAPSLTETFGNVMLEAMASGLAIVSADVPSARNLIAPGSSGLLVPPDPASYAKAITALVRDTMKRQRIGEAARAASAAFSWDEASRSVEEAYEGLVSAGGRTERV
ncbi:MAG TPA: glycosyltransferase family 1 protein [Allosphingosinicella sp.]|nr:glycosyltransferase family 1 protein [Allosphingosinicella sp.]